MSVFFELRSRSLVAVLAFAAACSPMAQDAGQAASDAVQLNPQRLASDVAGAGAVNPQIWPKLEPLPLDPEIEQRVDEILAKLTLEQKVGQVIQGDSETVTPEDVKTYRLGSVLSGGNSAPGPLPYASTEVWLEAADAYFNASIDPEGVEVAVPIIWGIDAVHGHANLRGATVFPHNIGLGATRNPELLERIMRITARELTVSGHDWTFAPTLAVPRDDRWGRSYEGFSESPAVVASYGDRIVYGLQGRLGDADFMGDGRVISSAKHFVGDGATLNGRDQGDAQVSEEVLRDIHAPGYMTAIPAGVQTVMASFSSWQGVKLHGSKGLLTDVLKERLGFNGFVVGDWNGHGQISGCTTTDCPQALNAGLDMYMAPDSWKGLYESTLAHVKSGRISQERLDDAVRRILRVKIASGIFEKPAPSERAFAGDETILGSPEHRAVARQAVRESLVLLKNDNALLPLNAAATVLVIGDGADNISKASGGWTLSWQGGGYPNEEFPNGESILDGIRTVVEAAGGSVIFDEQGDSMARADVVIAVYGEDPYAEFQGDRETLEFQPNAFDTAKLASYRERGVPVVSVFLSGRPLWTNPEMNASNAFVAAWLPGSEGGGIADLLFRTDPSFDFTGKLSFSWPNTALQTDLNPEAPDYDPLFTFGYGLSYEDNGNLIALSEVSGVEGRRSGNGNVFFAQGQAVDPWRLFIQADDRVTAIDGLPTSIGSLTITATDRTAQEDALQLAWTDGGEALRISAADSVDLERQSNGAMSIAFEARAIGSIDAAVEIGMSCNGDRDCDRSIPATIRMGAWSRHGFALRCFGGRGVDMSALDTVLILRSTGRTEIQVGDLRLEPGVDGDFDCDL